MCCLKLNRESLDGNTSAAALPLLGTASTLVTTPQAKRPHTSAPARNIYDSRLSTPVPCSQLCASTVLRLPRLPALKLSRRLDFACRTFPYRPLPLFVAQRPGGSLRIQGVFPWMRWTQHGVQYTQALHYRRIANSHTGVALGAVLEVFTGRSLFRNARIRSPHANSYTLHEARRSDSTQRCFAVRSP